MLLKPFVESDGETFVGYHHWCPGCESAHGIYVARPNRRNAKWTFDGNLERPTFGPSVRCFHWTKYKDDGSGDPAPGATEITDCHYFIQSRND